MPGNDAVTLVATTPGPGRSAVPGPRLLAVADGPSPAAPAVATPRVLGVAVIGDEPGVRAAARGWSLSRTAVGRDLAPALLALAGPDADDADEAAQEHDWQDVVTDWRRVLEREDVDLVHVCVPADLRPVVVAEALEAGKHVLCEAPVAASVEGARAMAAAAARAAERGITATVAMPLRRLPAVRLAHRLVAEGRLGSLRHVRARYEQDWLVDPQVPLSWRLQRERAGAGALAELGAHVVDLATFVSGERLVEATGLTKTFVHERPLPGDTRGLRSTPGAWSGPVTVDDAAVVLGRLDGGALAVLEASRVATGRRNAVRLEIDGSLGSLVLDSEEHDVLHLLDTRAGDSGWTRLHAPSVLDAGGPDATSGGPGGSGGSSTGPDGPEVAVLADLVDALAGRGGPGPSLAQALAVHELLAAAAPASGSAVVPRRSFTGRTQPAG